MLGLNKASCTSAACKWNSSFRKNVTASKVSEMELTRLGGKRKKPAPVAQPDSSVNAQMDAEIRAFGAQHGCVFMTSLDETGSMSKDSPGLPFTVAKICDIIRLRSNSAVCGAFCEQFVDRMPIMFRVEELVALEVKTREQSSSKLWFDHRHGRVTASIFGDVMAHMRSHTSSASLLDRICERQSVVKSRCPPALQWGRDNEQAAIDLLMKGLSASHVHARFERSGLIVKKEYPFLGASPDGIFACECAGCPRKRVVEVKCPYM